MVDIPTLFASLIARLCAGVATYCGQKPWVPRAVAHLPPDREAMERHRARMAPFVLLYTRLGRAAARFARLFARFRAGTLPTPGASRPRPGRPSIPYPRLPSSHGWLLRVPPDPSDITEARGSLRLDAVAARGALQRLLAHPDMPAFLAAAPQALRILRPLCNMVGLAPPAATPRPHPPGASCAAACPSPLPSPPGLPPGAIRPPRMASA